MGERTVRFQVLDKAIHCRGCVISIETRLSRQRGIVRVAADQTAQEVTVAFDADLISDTDVKQRLRELGFETS